MAVVWGPAAGYFARQSRVPLEIVPIPPSPRMPNIPQAFDISVAVSPRHAELVPEINQALRRNQDQIDRILEKYGVPLVTNAGPGRPARTRASARLTSEGT